MRTKYMIAVACGLLVAGTALAFGLTTTSLRAGDHPTATEPATVETDNCCLTGDCCCPGQGACCDPAAKAASSTVRYVKKAGAGCCSTGDCCCPGQGSCCGVTATTDEGKSCHPATTEKKGCCSK